MELAVAGRPRGRPATNLNRPVLADKQEVISGALVPQDPRRRRVRRPACQSGAGPRPRRRAPGTASGLGDGGGCRHPAAGGRGPGPAAQPG